MMVVPQYPIFGRPKMKTFSPFPPQFSSSSKIAMVKTFVKEMYNKAEEMYSNKGFTEGDFTQGGFTQGGFTEGGFTEAALWERCHHDDKDFGGQEQDFSGQEQDWWT